MSAGQGTPSVASWHWELETGLEQTLLQNPQEEPPTRISDLHFSEVPETKFLQLQEFSGSL